MKKFIAILFFTCLALSLAFGGAQKEGAAPTTQKAGQEVDLGGRVLRYISWWDPMPTDENWLAKLAYYEELYNFKLQGINSGDWQVHHDDLVASIAAGDPMGEFVYVDQSFFAGMVTKGLLQPVENKGVDFSDPMWHQIKRAGFTLLGHEYSVKDNFVEPGAGWWFNKSMLEREGIESIYDLQEKGQWNWNKMLEIAKKVTKDLDGDGTIDQWGFGEDVLHVLAKALILGNGGTIVDGTEFALDSPEALEALQFYQDLNLKHKVVLMRPEEVDWNWVYGEFGAGKSAFMPFFFWGTSQFGQPEDEIGWACFPAGPKGKMSSSFYPNNTVCIPAGVENVEDILFVWEQLWRPNPEFDNMDSDPYAWLYEQFKDIESVEKSMVLMAEKGYHEVLTHEIFGLKQTWEAVPGPILKGEKAPKAAIEEAKPLFEAKINEALGK